MEKSISLSLEKRITMPRIISVAVILVTIRIYISNDTLGAPLFAAALLLMLFGWNGGKMAKAIPVLLLFLVIAFMLAASGQMSGRGFNSPFRHALKFLNLFFAFTCYLYLKDSAEEFMKKLFVIGTIFAVTVSSLRSVYIILTTNDYAVRYASRYGEEAAGAANFHQVYAVPFFIVIVFFLLIYAGTKTWKSSLVLALILLANLYFIYRSLFTTALILTGLGILLLLYVKLFMRHRAFALALLLLFIVAFALVVFVFPEAVMETAKSATANMNYVLRSRLLYVLETILQVPSGIEYTYNRRMQLANYSLDTFRAHPFFGVGYAGYGYGVIGCHQEWADMLGVFGAIGSLIVFGILFWMFAQVFKGLESRVEKELYITAVILFIILGFLNPCMSAPVMMMVFVVVPNAKYLFGREVREYNDRK